MHCTSLKPTPGKRLTYEEASNIRRRQCGFNGTSLKVCCPDEAPSTTQVPNVSPSDVTVDNQVPTDLPLQCGHSPDFNRIFGGSDAPLGANPWMVALGYEAPTLGGQSSEVIFQCGASLITRQHVITAAHCVHPQSTGFLNL
ncbi:Serine proteases trypsin domain [Trinorchestia longiramus]|nr:Serine proteases trypsin domain [Trinorchestia longiramus]